MTCAKVIIYHVFVFLNSYLSPATYYAISLLHVFDQLPADGYLQFVLCSVCCGVVSLCAFFNKNLSTDVHFSWKAAIFCMLVFACVSSNIYAVMEGMPRKNVVRK